MELKINKKFIDEAVQDAVKEIKQNFIQKSTLDNLINSKSFEVTDPFNTYQFISVVRVEDLHDLMVGADMRGDADERTDEPV